MEVLLVLALVAVMAFVLFSSQASGQRPNLPDVSHPFGRPRNHGRRWSSSDLRKLSCLYNNRVPIDQMADELGRTSEAVRIQLRPLVEVRIHETQHETHQSSASDHAQPVELRLL
jgi:hypothetical protein